MKKWLIAGLFMVMPFTILAGEIECKRHDGFWSISEKWREKFPTISEILLKTTNDIPVRICLPHGCFDVTNVVIQNHGICYIVVVMNTKRLAEIPFDSITRMSIAAEE